MLGSHPRLIRPWNRCRRKALHAPVQINAKAAFEGDVWQWHQDYGTWAATRDARAACMNIAVS